MEKKIMKWKRSPLNPILVLKQPSTLLENPLKKSKKKMLILIKILKNYYIIYCF
jgi:hypothetical protein